MASQLAYYAILLYCLRDDCIEEHRLIYNRADAFPIGQADCADAIKYSRRNALQAIARIDATGMLLQFARSCALKVIPLWEAPKVVKEFLETGNAHTAYAAADAASRGVHTADAALAAHIAYAAAADAADATALGIGADTFRDEFAILVEKAFEQ